MNPLPSLDAILKRAEFPASYKRLLYYSNDSYQLGANDENARLMPLLTALAEALRVQGQALEQISYELSEHPLAMHAPSAGANMASEALERSAEILERGVGE